MVHQQSRHIEWVQSLLHDYYNQCQLIHGNYLSIQNKEYVHYEHSININTVDQINTVIYNLLDQHTHVSPLYIIIKYFHLLYKIYNIIIHHDIYWCNQNITRSTLNILHLISTTKHNVATQELQSIVHKHNQWVQYCIDQLYHQTNDNDKYDIRNGSMLDRLCNEIVDRANDQVKCKMQLNCRSTSSLLDITPNDIRLTLSNPCIDNTDSIRHRSDTVNYDVYLLLQSKIYLPGIITAYIQYIQNHQYMTQLIQYNIHCIIQSNYITPPQLIQLFNVSYDVHHWYILYKLQPTLISANYVLYNDVIQLCNTLYNEYNTKLFIESRHILQQLIRDGVYSDNLINILYWFAQHINPNTHTGVISTSDINCLSSVVQHKQYIDCCIYQLNFSNDMSCLDIIIQYINTAYNTNVTRTVMYDIQTYIQQPDKQSIDTVYSNHNHISIFTFTRIVFMHILRMKQATKSSITLFIELLHSFVLQHIAGITTEHSICDLLINQLFVVIDIYIQYIDYNIPDQTKKSITYALILQRYYELTNNNILHQSIRTLLNQLSEIYKRNTY